MKGESDRWFVPAILVVMAILALSYGGNYPGAVIGTMVHCDMTGPVTCEAYKAASGQLHTMITTANNGYDAIPGEEYDQCDAFIAWELPAGRYGNAIGSGSFELKDLNTISHQGDLACPVDPSGVVVQITENNQLYDATFGQLGANMDWTERITFHTYISPPECLVDGDCQTGYICNNGDCVQSTPPEEDCYNDADCPDGYICNDDNECELEQPEPEPIESNINPLFIAIGVILLGGAVIIAKKK